MKFSVKYNTDQLINILLKEQFENLGIQHSIVSIGEIDILDNLKPEMEYSLKLNLAAYEIEVLDDSKGILIQRIKDAITEIVYKEDNLPLTKISIYIAEKMQHSYGYLSNVFSEYCHCTIENFIILQKIERAKSLIIQEELSLTQISYILNYSSVAHLSSQFKKLTGLTPSQFSRIIKRKQATI